MELELGCPLLWYPQPNVEGFQKNVDTAFNDGRVLDIVKATCGDTGNVTCTSYGSTIWDHDSTPAPTARATEEEIAGAHFCNALFLPFVAVLLGTVAGIL